MGVYEIAEELNRSIQAIQDIVEFSSKDELEISLMKAAALREASMRLRSASIENRKIAEQTRQYGRGLSRVAI